MGNALTMPLFGVEADAGAGVARGVRSAGASVGSVGLAGGAMSGVRPPLPGMCVLASGSSGNCSAVWVGDERDDGSSGASSGDAAGFGGTRLGDSRVGDSLDARRGLVLIDLGLSPRRTRTRLESIGLALELTGSVLITHLDSDHCHPGWCSERPKLPAGCEVFVPRRSRDRAKAMNLNAGRFHSFDGPFRTRIGLEASPILMGHDHHGCAAFRLTTARERAWARANGRGSAGTGIGYATDLGRATPALIAHLREVSVLAIESNYCPTLQLASDRSEALKRRIMGGRGHLSNEECLEAIRAIQPRDHVVLLHLSQECNCPHLVASLHEGADYPLTISSQEEATRWVRWGRAEM